MLIIKTEIYKQNDKCPQANFLKLPSVPQSVGCGRVVKNMRECAVGGGTGPMEAHPLYLE
jgi:hypothetical protein